MTSNVVPVDWSALIPTIRYNKTKILPIYFVSSRRTIIIGSFGASPTLLGNGLLFIYVYLKDTGIVWRPCCDGRIVSFYY